MKDKQAGTLKGLRSVAVCLLFGAALILGDVTSQHQAIAEGVETKSTSNTRAVSNKTRERVIAKKRNPIGRCGETSRIPGSAEIIRVAKTPASSRQATVKGGPGYEGYEVWFAFKSGAAVGESKTRDWIQREHMLRLANSWYPGPKYLEKYGMQVGKTLPATLKVQISGPCAPFVFEFPSVRKTDYFETE